MNAALSCDLTSVWGIDHSAWSYTYWESTVDLKKKKKLASGGCRGSGLGHHTYSAIFYASVVLFACPGLAAAPVPALGVSWRKSPECKQLFCPHWWSSGARIKSLQEAAFLPLLEAHNGSLQGTRAFSLDGCHSNEVIPDHIHKNTCLKISFHVFLFPSPIHPYFRKS